MGKKMVMKLGILFFIFMILGGCSIKQQGAEETISVIPTVETTVVTEAETEAETETEAALALPMSEDEKQLWESLIARIYYVTYSDNHEKDNEVTVISKEDVQIVMELVQLVVADELVTIPDSTLDSRWYIEKVGIEQLIQNILDIDISGYTDQELEGRLDGSRYQIEVGDYGDTYPGAFFTDVAILDNGDIEIQGYAGFNQYDAVAGDEGVVFNPETEMYLQAQPFTVHLKAASEPIYTQYSLRDFKWE